MKKLFYPLFLVLPLVAVSCSDDEPSAPSNTITLNMMNADNGATTLGGSDVYINSADNFTSSRCGIADLGRGSNFTAAPNLSQISGEVAVTPGHHYQILPADMIREVAGERAFRVGEPYYNAYVESWITDRDNDITGARVSYLECTAKPGILPKWSSSININMRGTDYYERGAYSFSSGVVIDEDYEIYGGVLANSLEIDIEDNTITFTNRAYHPSSSADVVVLVRHNSVYSRVHFTVSN